ncbi:MAG: alpha/beta fold hydrolase [Planctomycetia bacterium]|nr:alpha/beta fold hydrolase [Planctomycetia bacterium]
MYRLYQYEMHNRYLPISAPRFYSTFSFMLLRMVQGYRVIGQCRLNECIGYAVYTLICFFCILGTTYNCFAEDMHDKIISFEERMDLLHIQDKDGTVRTIATTKAWEERKTEIFANVEKVFGPFPDSLKKCDLDVKYIEENDCGGYTRYKISFCPEPGDLAFAWLLVPKNHDCKLPAAVALHPTHEAGKDDSVGLTRRLNRNYGQELADRGYVVIAPDYWNFGECKKSPYDLGYKSQCMRGIWDHMRAVDLLATLDYVDSDRIAAIGHSLGGHNALFLAMYDPRIKVTVTSCGFSSFYRQKEYCPESLRGHAQDRYAPLCDTIYHCDPTRLPFDYNEILALIAPRTILINAPLKDDNFDPQGARECTESARKVYELYGRPDGLLLLQPNDLHDFPPEIRKTVYDMLDREFKNF